MTSENTELQPEKVLLNNIHSCQRNIRVLMKLRPNNQVIFKMSSKTLSLDFSGIEKISSDIFQELYETLPTLNSAIILNCFALFEASLESRLLQELNTENLSGVQEKVMNRYIDNIIKLSSIKNYATEFKFITGKSLKSFFENHYNDYEIIETLFGLRHILIHGSAIKSVYVPTSNSGGRIEMDADDVDFQKITSFLNDSLKIGIPENRFSLDLILINNKIADMLVYSVLVVSNKLLENTDSVIKFVKKNE